MMAKLDIADLESSKVNVNVVVIETPAATGLNSARQRFQRPLSAASKAEHLERLNGRLKLLQERLLMGNKMKIGMLPPNFLQPSVNLNRLFDGLDSSRVSTLNGQVANGRGFKKNHGIVANQLSLDRGTDVVQKVRTGS